ncbi:polysaccharide deacetylase family protein [Granulicella arctica]|uniref:Cellulose synthase/poly-beta-1,6-N-acetylglucosamine synthase-like glycosyltransferase/peptidoglycan/xylan/chitin deacetylase (PgdA/CDA1 family)/spore germination protein YaaH n=1 Tax=Granulicella arctica TaxID=940613 RepID=A0A7Y9PHT9_9BACT|nr:glycosyltransferase [Granulicella arctica]NYF80101.1 cellulose synthase/poly-beta-1,6-N-acetylglucosamine synthase-like glycosyltransferase/peptidoglycan/xylan/chitin deacetylase (PgdA/CDA1 family)/spore germination protein YaaH [Granulicella arctica]
MNKPVFYDPQRKRWKRLRRIFDVLALLGLAVVVLFAVGLLRMKPLPYLFLPTAKRNFRTLANRPVPALKPGQKLRRSSHRRTDLKPSDVPLNSGEGLRAAYYVEDDPASYSSLKQHIHQIDLLFPEWLHAVNPDGSLSAYTMDNRPYPVVDKDGVHVVDRENKVARAIADAHEDTEVFPLLNNYDPIQGKFLSSIGDMLSDPAARANFVSQVDTFLAKNPSYRGLSLDLEEIPTAAQPGFSALVSTLYADFHPRNLRLYVNTPVGDDDFDLKFIADHSDGLLLMNYDQHETGSLPGPIAAQDWFVDNLKNVLKIVPKEKVICAIGSYGYDWAMTRPDTTPAKGKKKKADAPKVQYARNMSTQDAWQAASDSESDVELDGDSLNAHFAYDDDDANLRHEVWFLDAATVLNEMRAAQGLGIQTFALWQLGSEDDSLWKIWDRPGHTDPVTALANVEPGYDVDNEGDGDIMRVTRKPQSGHRTVTMDDDDSVPVLERSITQEKMDSLPLSYTVSYYGYHPKQVALSFDDGPDPVWTPKILDILKQYHATGTFFMIGEEAQDNVGLMRRVYREGNEIGNHTYTHPDISEISKGQVDFELNFTERLFASKLGVQPLYFRPPYSIDQEPDTNDQAAPIDRIQGLGYVIVGNKIDTNDWDEHPKKSPKEISDSVFQAIADMEARPWTRGSIILMHDGGGDRSPTIAALPVLIQTLREHGYAIVPVSTLLGKTRAEVMPSLTRKQRWQAYVDSTAFFFISFFDYFVVGVFFVGDILMSGRLVIIGLFALIDRFRKRKNFASPDYEPQVAVLIPAYNEEKVIVRTIRSVMMSNYKKIRVVVIDDGSKDRTYDVAREAYPAEIASGRLTVLTKENGGKADALNFALESLEEEIYVGIDADGVIAHDAIARLVCHFANPKIGAVAGNAKVGNRVNLWTRWQALEYITSQNFERRALDLFDVVMVVPGAIGAWRTAGVKAGNGYHTNTVAEDADLTMNILEQGYSVIYEDQALAFTEAPVDMDGLMRQRFRWSFGILQAVFKHRGAIAKHRAMGLFALPNILIFQILLPLVSPLIDLMFVFGVIHYFIDKHFHPETTSTSSFYKLLGFFLAFLVIDFVTSALAFALERKHPASKGDGWLLFHIWIQRFTYRQVFSVVLFKTVKRAIDGKPFNWDKLDRTAKMSESTDKLMQE